MWWVGLCMDLSFPAEASKALSLSFCILLSRGEGERDPGTQASPSCLLPLSHFCLPATISPFPGESLCDPFFPLLFPLPPTTLTSCCEALGEKTLSSSKDTGFPLCSRWMMESSSGSKVTALVASGPSPSSLVMGRTRAITRMFPESGGGARKVQAVSRPDCSVSGDVLSSLVAQEAPIF